ncbi:MAG: V-type ATPase subunit [Myxococcota bacterium]
MTAELALVSRSRGLATHLLGREALESLADAPDFPAFCRSFAKSGRFEPLGDAPDIGAVEQSVRRTAARHLRTLSRWQEASPGVLDVFFAEQERRALRAFLRGALQGAPAEARLAGLLPTPGLPERALAQLARQPTPKDVVLQLVLLGHPAASRLLPLVARAQPELFALEVALLQGLAERAGRAARKVDPVLEEFVCARVDLGNAQNALLLGGGPRDVEPEKCFVEGGRWLSKHAFLDIARAPARPAALEACRRAFMHTPLSDAFPMGVDDAARVERNALAQTLARLGVMMRVEPLGSAALLRFLLELEAQSRDVRTLAWGVLLNAPPALRRQDLVTPWS